MSTTTESRIIFFSEYSLYETPLMADRRSDAHQSCPEIRCVEDERDWQPINVGGELGCGLPSDPDELPYLGIQLRTGELPQNDDFDGWAQRGCLAPKKILYIFTWQGNTGALFGAYIANDKGQMFFFTAADARALSTQTSAQPTPTPNHAMRLTHTVNGKRIYHSFLASRIPLTDSAIGDLEKNWPAAIPAVDLANDDHFVAIETFLGAEVGIIGYVDPVSIANNLQVRYTLASDDHVKYVSLSKDHTAAEREEFLKRGKKVALANILAQIQDPSGALENEYVGGSGAVGKFIKEYENRVYALAEEEARWNLTLTRWLNSSLMERVEGWYRSHPDKKMYSDYATLFSDWVRRLGKCEPGKRLLGQWMEKKPYVVATFVLPDPGALPSGPPAYEVTRKTFGATISLAIEFLPWYLEKYGSKSAVNFVRSMNKALGTDVVSIASITELIPALPFTKGAAGRTWGGGGREYGAARSTLVPTIRFAPGRMETSEDLAKWLKADSDAPGKPTQLFVRLTRLIEVGNVFLASKDAIGALVDQGWTFNSARSVLGALGAVADMVSSLKLLFKLATRTAAFIGAVSAAIDAVLAVSNALGAFESDDDSAGVGYSMVAVGSFALLATGIATFAVGTEIAVVTPITAGAAVVIAAGTILYVFTTDSDLEQFASHCEFGVSFKKKSKKKPGWSDTSFAKWLDPKTGLDAQLRALFTLLGAFTVESIHEAAVRIHFGFLVPASTVLIEFDCELFELSGRADVEGKAVSFRPWYEVDIDSGTMKQLGGDHGQLDLIRCGKDDKGRFIEVTAEPSDDSGIKSDLCDHIRASCKVKLVFPEQDNVARQSVPPNGVPLAHAIHSVVDGFGPDTKSFA